MKSIEKKTVVAAAVAVAALAVTLSPAPAGAGELAGVELPDTKTVAGREMVLNGMGLRKVAFFKVYVAGLYLPEEETSPEAVLSADAPRHLEMHWLRSGGKDKICDAWYEGLENNTPNASAEVRAQFDTLCEWMPDAEDGDVMAFTYVPDEGTRVDINGTDKGVLQGKAFADALYRSWIGPNPGPGEKFREGLMGG